MRRLNDFTCKKVNKYLVFACGLSRSLERDRLFRPRVTSRFANVPFANVLCCFAKKRNERCACICFVLSATDQEKAVKELTQHASESTSEVGEQDVGETTVNRLWGPLMGGAPDVNSLILFTCFNMFPREE